VQPPVRKTDGWKHQVAAYHAAVDQPAFLLGMDMGTGKSKVAIDLVVNWKCKRVLIVCPKSVLGVWPREFERHCPIEYLLLTPIGSSKQKKAMLEVFTRQQVAPMEIVLINYDSVWRPPLGATFVQSKKTGFRYVTKVGWMFAQKWDAIILDESHRIKAHNSAVSRFFAGNQRHDRLRCSWGNAKKLCLTGTPIPHSPMDPFGQFRFLNDREFGRSFTEYRHRYARMESAVPRQITGYQNLDELAEKIAPYIFQVGNEVLNLPPVQHHTRTCELSTEGRKHYRELEKEWITEIESGVVTASNALTRSIRLRQAVSGYLADDETGVYTTFCKAKQSLLIEVLEDIGDHPVVVFANFRYDLRRIREVASKLGRTYGELSGSQKDLTDTAELPSSIDVLGAQIQAASLGVDLTGSTNKKPCRYVIYYDHPWSLGDYEQSLARVHRPGQTHNVNYYHLVAEHTIDEKVIVALEKKKDVIREVLNLAQLTS